MKKSIIILALIILGIFITYRVYYNYISSTGYIEKITNIKLPFWSKTIEVEDNMEFCVIGKYQLPISSIDEFCKSHEITKKCDTDVIPLIFEDYLKERNRPLKADLKDCLSYSNCNQWNTWNILVNKNTSELWIEVSYPDMSGDAIPCDNF